MRYRRAGIAIAAGLAGGIAANTLLGLIFTSPWIHGILYNPRLQSALFIEITATRNIPVSVVGLIVLGIVYSSLFAVLRPAIPGSSWIAQGLFWGLSIWLVYWLPQEWFIYYTLLKEPLPLVALELTILLTGSLVQGVVIAFLLSVGARRQHCS